MKEQFTAEVKLDYAAYRRFAEFQLFKGKSPLIKKAVFYGFGLVAAIFLFLLGIAERNTSFLMLGGILLLCIALFTYLVKQVPKKQFRKNKKLLEVVQYYVFAPDGIIIELKSGEIDSREEVFYSELYRIYELKDAFYLYADKKSAFIIPKNSLKNVTTEQAREFFLKKVPDYKYIAVR